MEQVPPWAGLLLAGLAVIWWKVVPSIADGQLRLLPMKVSDRARGRLIGFYRWGVACVGIVGLLSSVASIVARYWPR